MITSILLPIIVFCVLSLALGYLAMLIKNVDLAGIITNIAAVFFGLAIIWFIIAAIAGLFGYI